MEMKNAHSRGWKYKRMDDKELARMVTTIRSKRELHACYQELLHRKNLEIARLRAGRKVEEL
jgi:hypothetical protein